jgi:ABC-2 type transport system ATP-binding protein
VLVLRGGSRVASLEAEDMAGEEGARAYRALLD